MRLSPQADHTAPDSDRHRLDRSPSSLVSGGRAAAWVLLGGVRTLWRRFHDDSRALPQEAWRRWRRALAVGFVLTLLVNFGLTRLGQSWEGRGLQAWDAQMLRRVVSEGPLTFANAITWQAPGDLLFQPIFVLAFVAIMAWFSRPLIAATMAAGYVLTLAFIWTGWGLWNRSRPDVVAGGIAAPGFHSFPSGHAVLVVVVYGLVAYLWVRASRSWLERLLAIGVFIVWTAMVDNARLALGSHWPSDVLAGFTIGLVWLIMIIIALRRAERAVVSSQSVVGADN